MSVRRTLAFTLVPALLLALAACGTKGASDYDRGVEAGQAGGHGSSVEHYNAAIAANPEFSEVFCNRSFAELHLAREAALAKRDADAAKAVTSFETLEKLKPDDTVIANALREMPELEK